MTWEMWLGLSSTSFSGSGGAVVIGDGFPRVQGSAERIPVGAVDVDPDHTVDAGWFRVAWSDPGPVWGRVRTCGYAFGRSGAFASVRMGVWAYGRLDVWTFGRLDVWALVRPGGGGVVRLSGYALVRLGFR